MTPPSQIEGAGLATMTIEEIGEGPAWLGSMLPWKDVAVNSEFKRACAIGRWGISQMCLGMVGRITITRKLMAAQPCVPQWLASV